MGDKVIELVRVGYIAPRLLAILMCCIWLYIMGWFGPQVKRGKYTPEVKVGYWIGTVGYVFAALYSALTI